jgi:aryl sulfotransferase
MTAPARIVWLASFPKSGNTWFRIFLANLAAGEKGPADINNLDERGGIASSRYEFEAVTFLDSGLMSHDDIDELRPRVYEAIAEDTTEQRWIKVHDAYTLTRTGDPLFGSNLPCTAVYVARDPRGVAGSLSYHMNTSIDDAIELMNNKDGALCSGRKGLVPQLRQKLTGWSSHVTSWLDQTNVPVHLVRYEDLIAEPVAYFSAALKFAGRSATSAEIERAVRYTDFAELQRQEKERGFAERISRKAPFFRVGRTEAWRETLTAEQTKTIERHHGAVMTRLGYRLKQ